jgi:hypothetical protein
MQHAAVYVGGFSVPKEPLISNKRYEDTQRNDLYM